MDSLVIMQLVIGLYIFLYDCIILYYYLCLLLHDSALKSLLRIPVKLGSNEIIR